jgi:hypothetical protein
VWIESVDEFHTESETVDDEKPKNAVNFVVTGGASTVASETSAAPTEAKDEPASYRSAQLYGHPDTNEGV